MQILALSKRAEKIRIIYERTKTQLKKMRMDLPKIKKQRTQRAEDNGANAKLEEKVVSKQEFVGILEKYKHKVA